MRVIETNLKGVLILEPRIFEDPRGFFMETYQKARYRNAGVDADFVQDNLSFSCKKTLRGLHFQYPRDQAKLVQVLQGEVFDVAVDIRKGSPSFGKWSGSRLTAENKRQMFIPAGFAHGFCVLSDIALFHYKCSDYYSPECESGVLWCDPDLAIDWPVRDPILSQRDADYQCLADIAPGRLPEYEKG
jgi:dTDP-4-dehydrorhamnose 3,5-epimerase